MTDELFLAILAMDSYHRGDAGLALAQDQAVGTATPFEPPVGKARAGVVPVTAGAASR